MAPAKDPSAIPTEEKAGVVIDPVTGHATTGHTWDGIAELNRPLPRWWLITFYASIIFAFGYVILYPAIPLLRGATPGVLGYSTRGTLESDLAAARLGQGARLDAVAKLPLAALDADPDLRRFAAAGGRSAFLVNCVPCHGSGAAGSPGYANLNDDDWLWGGSLDAIRQTIAFGVRSAHPDTRTSVMPAFGAEGLLKPPQILAVGEYVLSLSGRASDAKLAAAGGPIFAENCALCHGPAGEGSRKFGAPPLNDAIWLYGGDRTSVLAQITLPRVGVMPAWSGRLDEAVIKQLAIFVHSLGGGEAAAGPATP